MRSSERRASGGPSDLARLAGRGGPRARPPSAARPVDAGPPRPIHSPGVRYLGVGLGRARIGLALADEILRTARPHSTVHRRGGPADLDAIADVARAFEVTRAVVGLPLNMDGTEGSSARLARAFAGRIGASLGVPVDLFDERLSTFEAEGRLRDRGVPAREWRSLVDAEAAAVILQGWLDGGGR